MRDVITGILQVHGIAERRLASWILGEDAPPAKSSPLKPPPTKSLSTSKTQNKSPQPKPSVSATAAIKSNQDVEAAVGSFLSRYAAGWRPNGARPSAPAALPLAVIAPPHAQPHAQPHAHAQHTSSHLSHRAPSPYRSTHSACELPTASSLAPALKSLPLYSGSEPDALAADGISAAEGTQWARADGHAGGHPGGRVVDAIRNVSSSSVQVPGSECVVRIASPHAHAESHLHEALRPVLNAALSSPPLRAPLCELARRRDAVPERRDAPAEQCLALG
uniref:Uncharacterized protein n=1 Tax=Haptolina brevifila TaxID=156173 RepID=A0A7S2CYV3_9EUKA